MEGHQSLDEDGVRTVWDSKLSTPVRKARREWENIVKEENAVSWDQTSSDLSVLIVLPKGTTAKDLKVKIGPTTLKVNLNWYGDILDGPLSHHIKSTEAAWSIEGAELMLILPKGDQDQVWRSLMEGGPEKSHREVLQEMVEADEPHQSYDDISMESKMLIEEIRERQAMVTQGLFDIENSFDDFRVVLGDE